MDQFDQKHQRTICRYQANSEILTTHSIQSDLAFSGIKFPISAWHWRPASSMAWLRLIGWAPFRIASLSCQKGKKLTEKVFTKRRKNPTRGYKITWIKSRLSWTGSRAPIFWSEKKYLRWRRRLSVSSMPNCLKVLAWGSQFAGDKIRH